MYKFLTSRMIVHNNIERVIFFFHLSIIIHSTLRLINTFKIDIQIFFTLHDDTIYHVNAMFGNVIIFLKCI